MTTAIPNTIYRWSTMFEAIKLNYRSRNYNLCVDMLDRNAINYDNQ